MNKFKDLKLHMRQHPDWEKFEEWILSHQPVLPVFDPKNDNSVLWRQRSGEKVGFDNALLYFEIITEN